MEQTSFVIFPQDSLLLSPNLRHISTLKKPFYGWNKKVFGKCEKQRDRKGFTKRLKQTEIQRLEDKETKTERHTITERERERDEIQIQTLRGRAIHVQTERERHTHKELDTHIGRERDTYRERDTHIEKEILIQKYRERHIDRKRDTQTEREIDKQRERKRDAEKFNEHLQSILKPRARNHLRQTDKKGS